jgi:molybdate transport system substrate-binding protein
LNITVLATPAIREAYAELVPVFEKSTRHEVTTTWVGTADLAKRLDDGQVFDAIVCASNLLAALTESGNLASGRIDVARSRVGVAVKTGARRPDFASEEALKRALRSARSIGISTGPSGVYLRQLFQRIGVLEEIRPKF